MWGRRNGGAELAEKVTALEVRLARLAEEVHEAVARIEVWGAREVARQAAFEEATDKLYRTAERARKLRGRADGTAEGDDDDFWEAFERRRGVALPPG